LTLLKHYQIEKPLISHHDHSSPEHRRRLAAMLREGKHISLVSDGGTPLMNDPGFELMRFAREFNIPVEILPGPCSIISGLVLSGLAVDSFSFFGFLPQKSSQRKKIFTDLLAKRETLIFFESPFRIEKSVTEALEVLGDREAAIVREMTKKFEETLRGTLSQLVTALQKRPRKGEMVLVIAGADRKKLFAAGNFESAEQSVVIEKDDLEGTHES
jgi:16S rRNA (cytidine1402-2'-O)-methyltransferase